MIFFCNSGSNASLVCKVGSLPAGDIIWQKDGIEIRNNSYRGDNRVRDAAMSVVINMKSSQDVAISTLVLTNAHGRL